MLAAQADGSEIRVLIRYVRAHPDPVVASEILCDAIRPSTPADVVGRVLWIQERILRRDVAQTVLSRWRPDVRIGSAEIRYVSIPSGECLIGSPPDDPECHWSETPQRRVSVTSFELAATPMTVKQCERLGVGGAGLPGDLPAGDLSWWEARAIAALCGARLPTSVEYEYACRAGTSTRWYTGDDPEQLLDHEWFYRNSGNTLVDPSIDMEKPYNNIHIHGKWECRVHPVGSRLPNPWGLYDMAGNVSVWCEDVVEVDAAGNWREATRLDSESPWRIARGAGYPSMPSEMRSASFARAIVSNRYPAQGVRLARDGASGR